MCYKLRIHHIDVGQGDATLFILKKDDLIEKAILIDSGNYKRHSWRVALFCAQKLRGIPNVRPAKKLDAIVISHFDADHIGGLSYFKCCQKIWGQFMTDSTCIFTPVGTKTEVNKLSDVIKKYKIKRTVQKKPNFDLFEEIGLNNPSITMKCLAANCWIINGRGDAKYVKGDYSDGSEKNRVSLAFLLEFFKFRYYTGGDIGASQEEAFAEYIKYLNAFKVSHHGAETSTPEMLVRKCLPGSSAVISYGHGRHPHPTDLIVTRLLQNESIAKIYFTGQIDQYNLNGLLESKGEKSKAVVINEDQLFLEKQIKIVDTEDFYMVAPGVITCQLGEAAPFYYMNYDRFDKKREVMKDIIIMDNEFPKNGLYEIILSFIQHTIGMTKDKRIVRENALRYAAELAGKLNSRSINDKEQLYKELKLLDDEDKYEKEIELLAEKCYVRIMRYKKTTTYARKTRGYYGKKKDMKLCAKINKMTDVHDVVVPTKEYIPKKQKKEEFGDEDITGKKRGREEELKPRKKQKR